MPQTSGKIFATLMLLLVGLLCTLQTLPNVVDPYCDMIQIHQTSDGRAGWVPYKGTEQCR